MKPKFIQCQFCKKEITRDACELATYRTVIDGKKYVFCCEICAQRYQQKKNE